jgi:hypothetical protein
VKLVDDATLADFSSELGSMLITVSPSADRRPLVVLAVDPLDVQVLLYGASNRCGRAAWAGNAILASAGDCDAGNSRAYLFSETGKHMTAVGKSLDMTDSAGEASSGGIAIVAPRAYALVLVSNSDWRAQQIVSLIPLQLFSESSPTYRVAPLADGDWLVASDSGGVGVVDGTTGSFQKTWSVPGCAP